MSAKLTLVGDGINDPLARLSPEARERLEQAQKLWEEMDRGAELERWLSSGPVLLDLRELAMQAARARRPAGAAYAREMSKLVARCFNGMDEEDVGNKKRTSSRILWFYDDEHRLKVLRDIQAAMKPGERARMSALNTAYKKVRKEMERRSDEHMATLGVEEPVVVKPPRQTLTERVVELEEENQRLHEREARREADQGSHLDLKEKATDIAATVIRSINRARWKQIVAAVEAAFNDYEAGAKKQQAKKPRKAEG